MAVALFASLILAAGCSRWSQTSIRPQASASEKLPGLLRIHMKDGRTLKRVDASVVGDSLVGVLEARPPVGLCVVAVFAAAVALSGMDGFGP